MLAFLLWGLLACGRGGDEASLFVQAVERGGEEGARACRELGDEELRARCLYETLEGDPLEWDCGELPAGTWRDECRFRRAEALARRGRGEEAVRACTEPPNRFAHPCLVHASWKLARSAAELPPEQAEEVARPLRAVPELPDAPRFYWQKWWRLRLEAGGTLDPRLCSGLREPEPCVAGLHARLGELLEGWRRAHPGFCSSLVAGPSPLPGPSGEAAWVDLPELRAFVLDWARRNCGEAARGSGSE